MYRSQQRSFRRPQQDPPENEASLGIQLSSRQLELLEKRSASSRGIATEPFRTRSNLTAAKKEPSVADDKESQRALLRSMLGNMTSIPGNSSSISGSSNNNKNSRSPKVLLKKALQKAASKSASLKESSKQQWRKLHTTPPKEKPAPPPPPHPPITTTAEFQAFLDELKCEVSNPHSELLHNFAGAFDVTVPIPNPSKLSKSTVKIIKRINLQLLKVQTSAGESQLVSDKQYAKEKRQQKSATKTVHHVEDVELQPSDTSTTLSSHETSVATGATASKPIPLCESLSVRTSTENTNLPTTMAPTNSYAKDKVLQKTKGTTTEIIASLSQRTTAENPSKVDTENVSQNRLDGQSMGHANVYNASSHSRFGNSSKPITVENVTLQSRLGNVSKEQAARNVENAFQSRFGNSGSKSPPWKRVTLRPVSGDNSNPPHIPRRDPNPPPTPVQEDVGMEEEPCNEQPNDQEPPSIRNTTKATPEPKPGAAENDSDEKFLVDEDDPCRVVSVPLKNASNVLVGKRTIRCVSGSGIWGINRKDMEPDGMTLKLRVLKVTLLMQNGSHKVLGFDTPEHVLKFATAFYHDAPPVTEVTGCNSSVTSSVREPLTDEEQTVLDKYRELRQTKGSSEALKETITCSTSTSMPGRAEALTTALVGESRLPTEVGTDLPSSPVSTFTSTSVGTKTTDNELTEEENKLAETYRLMLRRGVPADAVRHRLTKDHVDVKIVAVIFDDPPVQNPVVPEVRPAPPKSNLSEKEEEIAGTYRKMLKMRIPPEAVRHKMTQDQVDAKIVAEVLGDKLPEPPKPETSSKITEKRKNNLTNEEEVIASEYRKLLKLKIPRDQILSRMQREDVSEKIIKAVLGISVSSNKDELKPSSSYSTGSNLINLHWNVIDDVPAGSVWETQQATIVEDAKLDVAKLTSLFERKKTTRKEPKKNNSDSGVGQARLLDLTRSNNIAISLKAFKEFAFKELADIIAFLDPLEKVKGDQSQFILDLLPTLTEAKTIANYTGSDDQLDPAEVWFRKLKGIKRIETKAKVIRTMEMFVTEVTGVKNNFELLNRVCSQVIQSSKLQELLGIVLRIGNVMNEGTRTGGAAGFRFDSLLRLTQTKTSDGKITLLDYLVTVFAEADQRDTLSLALDFPDIHVACRLMVSDMTNEVTVLQDALDTCKKELADLKRDQNPTKPRVNAPAADPRAALFASITARGNGPNDSQVPNSASFAKRDQFLAALQSKKESPQKRIVVDSAREDKPKEPPKKARENSVKGGIERLRSFIETAEESFSDLSRLRSATLKTCRELANYCGESGGVGSVTTLLDILSQFAKNIESAVKTYDDRQIIEARRRKTRSNSVTPKASHSKKANVKNSLQKNKSLVLLVNDVLKNANPRFKEDFKKGRVVANPSNTLQAIYEREKQLSSESNSNKEDTKHQSSKQDDVEATLTPVLPLKRETAAARRAAGMGSKVIALEHASARSQKSDASNEAITEESMSDSEKSVATRSTLDTRIEDHSGSGVAMDHSSTDNREEFQSSFSSLRTNGEALISRTSTGSPDEPYVEAILVDSSCGDKQPEGKKSISEKARERRQEKTTIGERRVSSPIESNTARLARMKRLSKRMSR